MNNIEKILDELNYRTHKQIVGMSNSYTQAHQRLLRAKKTNKIHMLKRGIYITEKRLQKLINTGLYNHRLYYIACEVIYPGSIISLETGLALHQIIPEMVTNITCISTKKTYTCTNKRTTIYYRNIKDDMNRGYDVIIKEKMLIRIADAEKSLIDRFWLCDYIIWEESRFYELRIDFDVIDMDKLSKYIYTLKSPKMNNVLLFLKKISG